MESQFDWKESTPAELRGIVLFLQKTFEDWEWEVDQVTQKLCCAMLHQNSHVENLNQYLRAFEQMKAIVGSPSDIRFSEMVAGRIAPGFFGAFAEIRKELLGKRVIETFGKLVAIARTQKIFCR